MSLSPVSHFTTSILGSTMSDMIYTSFFSNEIEPALSTQEIIDFIFAPYNEDECEFFKGYEKFNENFKEEWEAYENRNDIPQGLSKKEYTALKKEAKKNIESLKEEIRKWKSDDKDTRLMDIRFDEMVEKEKKLSRIVKMYGSNTDIKDKIERAKLIPIETILKVDRYGTMKCPIHSGGNERTPSFHVYVKENRWHCFGACGEGGDVIDLVSKMQSVSFGNAVKFLLKED